MLTSFVVVFEVLYEEKTITFLLLPCSSDNVTYILWWLEGTWQWWRDDGNAFGSQIGGEGGITEGTQKLITKLLSL